MKCSLRLQDLDSRPCPSSIDPHYLVRELAKEVRLAERISNKCNPPKPERESKRKKQKKQLNADFIDITHGSALFLLTGRSNQVKNIKIFQICLKKTCQNFFHSKTYSFDRKNDPRQSQNFWPLSLLRLFKNLLRWNSWIHLPKLKLL
jgi:hypothetical protein